MSSDIAEVRIARPVAEVLAFMSDPTRMDLWSFGTWRITVETDGLVRGTSIMDGAPICVRIVPHADQGLIDYLIGATPDSLVPRIFVRVVAASNAGGRDGESILMMIALRGDGMDDARWQQLITAHAFEVGLIKSAIETGFDHRKERR